MKVLCIACGRDVNLDHAVFQDYEGPVKCFSCGTMMAVRTAKGMVDNVALLREAAVYGEKAAVAKGGRVGV